MPGAIEGIEGAHIDANGPANTGVGGSALDVAHIPPGENEIAAPLRHQAREGTGNRGTCTQHQPQWSLTHDLSPRMSRRRARSDVIRCPGSISARISRNRGRFGYMAAKAAAERCASL